MLYAELQHIRKSYNIKSHQDEEQEEKVAVMFLVTGMSKHCVWFPWNKHPLMNHVGSQQTSINP
jgi:hypothetical protein